MLVKELIAQLEKCNPDDYVELYHERYNGGGDESTWDDPAVFLSDSAVIIAPVYYRGMVNKLTGPVFTVEELEN